MTVTVFLTLYSSIRGPLILPSSWPSDDMINVLLRVSPRLSKGNISTGGSSRTLGLSKDYSPPWNKVVMYYLTISQTSDILNLYNSV
ncbi:hypothetical protein GDO86_002691 [Hymenochirus boettgeri]|uniref:Uncharacterized protein n=1 Tax=Hymenochirus boettgeri TaxID=247094 RepID=A0A8T2JY28_9PIPI|nr:hypothetical protein GDO86_002691 [Hymenochirus boettgeri]